MLKILIIFSSVIFASLYGMNDSAANAMFHLALVPVEVRDLIASYLGSKYSETDAAFIARTRVTAGLRSDYHKDKLHKPLGLENCTSGRSPDFTKGIFVEQGAEGKKSKVIMSDSIQSKQAHCETLAQLVDDDKHLGVILDDAISNDGMWFGKMCVKDVTNYGEYAHFVGCMYQVQITVADLNGGQRKDFIIPELLRDICFLEFNKQGTKIITHGYHKDILKNFMYALTTPEEHLKKSKKTLDEYFRQRRVCKKVANSLPKKE